MDNIVRWMENNKVCCYAIFGAGNEKRSNRICDSVGEAISEFSKDYEILPDGKYHVKGMDKPHADKAAVRMDFQIGISNTNHTSSMSLEQMRTEIYAQAKKDFEFEAMMREFAEIKREHKIIIQILKEKFDDNEDNDENADKLLETISTAKEKFDGVSGLFKDLKFS